MASDHALSRQRGRDSCFGQRSASVLGILRKGGEQDEADTIFDIALGEDRNEWAQKRGYSGIDDPAFLSESRTMLLRNMNSKDSQDELGAMLSDSVVAIDTQVKGMGGR